VYKECRKALEDMGIRQVIDPFTQNSAAADQQVIKYAARIIQKLNMDNAQ
jgi:hypothetical protein